MSRSKRLAAAVLLMLLLTAMRDPFRPPPDRCMAAALTQWRYRGMVVAGEAATGIVREPQGRWRRVRAGDTLPGGWRIDEVGKEAMRITLAQGCEPQRWHWQREGVQDATKSDGDAVPYQHAGKRKSARAGHADGG
uniref:HofP DNA utilization family protein n=1 Tax=Phytobacter massiliensis TaxID=1485952 RepID=UPI003BAA962B